MNVKLKEWLDYVQYDFRLFPKVIAGFLAWTFYNFNTWFLSSQVAQTDFGLVQYGVVTMMYIGFAKFYMDSGKGKDK